MRALLQRVSESRCRIAGEVVGQSGKGFCILLGITHEDTKEQADWLVKKIAALRVFEDEAGKLNLSIKDIAGSILLVSQFTLYADCSHGNRPGFTDAATPSIAEPLYEYFAAALREQSLPVETGVFGADMKIELINDGPVTVMLER